MQKSLHSGHDFPPPFFVPATTTQGCVRGGSAAHQRTLPEALGQETEGPWDGRARVPNPLPPTTHHLLGGQSCLRATGAPPASPAQGPACRPTWAWEQLPRRTSISAGGAAGLSSALRGSGPPGAPPPKGSQALLWGPHHMGWGVLMQAQGCPSCLDRALPVTKGLQGVPPSAPL